MRAMRLDISDRRGLIVQHPSSTAGARDGKRAARSLRRAERPRLTWVIIADSHQCGGHRCARTSEIGNLQQPAVADPGSGKVSLGLTRRGGVAA